MEERELIERAVPSRSQSAHSVPHPDLGQKRIFPKKEKENQKQNKSFSSQNYVRKRGSSDSLPALDRFPSWFLPLLRPRRRVQTLYRPLAPCARLEKVQAWFHQGRTRRLGVGERANVHHRRIPWPTPFPQVFFTYGIQKSFIRHFLSK